MHSKVLLLSLLSPVAFAIPFWHYQSDVVSASSLSTPYATPTGTPIFTTPEPTFETPTATVTATPVDGSPTPTPSGYEPSYPELEDVNAIYYHFDDAA